MIVKDHNIKVSSIVYIGANEGQDIQSFIKLFGNIPIHLFEPQKKVFAKLKKNFSGFENLFFYDFALGSDTKKDVINTNINNKNMSSSLLKPKEHLKYHPKIKFEGQEEIQVKKFIDLNLRDINMINLDVQGYELEVLKGFTDQLNSVDIIVCEVNRKELYDDCVLVNELDKYLNKYNFLRIKTFWFNKTIPWGDAIYLKTNKVNIFNLIKIKIKNRIELFKGYFLLISIPIKFKKFFKGII